MKRKQSRNASEKQAVASLSIPSLDEVTLYPLNLNKQFENLRKLGEQLLHYATIIESSSDAIYTLSLSGIITSWNKGAQMLFGYKASEIVGKHVSLLLPEDRQEEVEKYKEFLQNKTDIRPIESERLRRDGSMVSVLITISAMRDVTGRAVGASVISRDISKRKKALADLSESRQLLQTIFDQAPIGITLVDNNLHFIMANNFFCKILGYSKRELMKMSFHDFSHPDDRSIGIDMQREVFSGERQFYEVEKRYVTNDGKFIFVRLKAIGIRNLKGKVIYKLGLIEDITARREIEIQKDEFISIAAHELKTPVTTMKAYTQILEKRLGEGGDTKDRYIVKNINAQADKLTHLITDLLNVNRISAGKLALHSRKFDLDALLKKIVIDFQYTIDSHVIKLEGSVGRKVYGDEIRIEEVIINLVTNAVKYSPQADSVILMIKSNATHAEVCVRDFGPGIPKKNRAKLFERFYRAQVDERDQSRGFGLGLYISKEIVQQHGGKIWIESPKVGTKFCFTVPFRKIRS